jgi:hypothetical protein
MPWLEMQRALNAEYQKFHRQLQGHIGTLHPIPFSILIQTPDILF